MVFAYNIVADCRGGAGWYADIDAKSCRIIGNAFWNLSGDGIYNEAGVDNTLVIGNYFYKCGASSSACRRLNIVDNFFEEGRVVWHSRDWGLDRYSYMLLRGNAFFNPRRPTCRAVGAETRSIRKRSAVAWWTTTASGPRRAPY